MLKVFEKYISKKEYKKNLSYLYERVNKDRFKEIYDEILKYIDERID